MSTQGCGKERLLPHMWKQECCDSARLQCDTVWGSGLGWSYLGRCLTLWLVFRMEGNRRASWEAGVGGAAWWGRVGRVEGCVRGCRQGSSPDCRKVHPPVLTFHDTCLPPPFAGIHPHHEEDVLVLKEDSFFYVSSEKTSLLSCSSRPDAGEWRVQEPARLGMLAVVGCLT